MAALNRLFDYLPADIAQLLARVIVGLVFWRSGLTKIDGFGLADNTIFLFEAEYNVPLLPPALAAYMATAAELALPLLLFVGLFSRFAATGLFLMTLVIQLFVYPSAYMTHGLWAVGLLLIMTFGPGRLSLDHVLGWEPGRKGLSPRARRARLSRHDIAKIEWLSRHSLGIK